MTTKRTVLLTADGTRGSVKAVVPDVTYTGGGGSGTVGPQGPAGPQGPTGAQGPSGATGATGSPGLVWRGTWVNSFQYSINDVVFVNGSAWVAVTSNINTNPNPSADGISPATQWNLVARKGADGTGGSGSGGLVWSGTWASGTPYAASSVVYRNGSAWVSNTSVSGTTPGAANEPNPTGDGITPGAGWNLLAQKGSGFTFKGTWVAGTYAINDVVTQNGSSWVSTSGSNGTTPNPSGDSVTPNAGWSLLAQKGAVGATGPQGPAGTGGSGTTVPFTAAGQLWVGTGNTTGEALPAPSLEGARLVKYGADASGLGWFGGDLYQFSPSGTGAAGTGYIRLVDYLPGNGTTKPQYLKYMIVLKSWVDAGQTITFSTPFLVANGEMGSIASFVPTLTLTTIVLPAAATAVTGIIIVEGC